MSYRLKDRELQKKLDEISDGDFSARLHKERELIKDSFQKEPRLHVLWFGEGSQFSAALYADMLEEVREYDPHGWNAFPEVEPPEGVWMRCETDVNAIEHKIRHVAKFDGREWRDYLSKQVVVHRFRPWTKHDAMEKLLGREATARCAAPSRSQRKGSKHRHARTLFRQAPFQGICSF